MPQSDGFLWSDSLRIGDSTVDREHEHLFGIANRALSVSDPEQEQEQLRAILREMEEYVRAHFEHEERLMRRLEFPGLEEHAAAHLRITASIGDLLANTSSIIGLGASLGLLLEDWILKHILEEDMKIKEWMCSRGGSEGWLKRASSRLFGRS